MAKKRTMDDGRRTTRNAAGKLLNGLVAWNQVGQVLEATLVDNLAATTPWLAPLAPAFMAYRSMTTHLDFPVPIALAIAATVEFLGLATVSTTFMFRSYNKRYVKSIAKNTKQAAPTWLAVLTMLVYLIVLVLLIVLLELNPEQAEVQVAAKGLLSALGLVGAAVVAMRGEHRQKTGKWDMSYQLSAFGDQSESDRKEDASGGKVAGKVAETGKGTAIVAEALRPQWRDWRDVPESEYQRIASLTVEKVMREYGRPERTARNWIGNAKGALNGGKPLQDELPMELSTMKGHEGKQEV